MYSIPKPYDEQKEAEEQENWTMMKNADDILDALYSKFGYELGLYMIRWIFLDVKKRSNTEICLFVVMVSNMN